MPLICLRFVIASCSAFQASHSRTLVNANCRHWQELAWSALLYAFINLLMALAVPFVANIDYFGMYIRHPHTVVSVVADWFSLFSNLLMSGLASHTLNIP